MAEWFKATVLKTVVGASQPGVRIPLSPFKIKANIMQFDIKAAHHFCYHNQKSVQRSKLCGCFYCLNIFPSKEVVDYVDNSDTALCPYCSIDSVLCDTDIEFDKSTLLEMKDSWF